MNGEQLALIGEAQAYEAADAWKHRWEECIREFAKVPGLRFTSEYVRAVAGEPTDHPNAAGAIFSKLAHQGVIRRIGYVKSERPSLHAHPLAEWTGA